MEINLRNLILAGIGTIAYTYEMAANMVDELVKRGELTVAQGKQLNEELKRSVMKKDDLATKQDIEELRNRIANLENK